MSTIDNNIQRLEKELLRAKETFDQEKIISTLKQLLEEFEKIRANEGIQRVAKELIPLLSLKKDKEEEAKVLLSLGLSLELTADYDEAIITNKKALEIFRKLKMNFGIASCYLGMGSNYSSFGKYKKALSYLFSAIKIFENNKDLLEKSENGLWNLKYADTLVHIGIIYYKLNQIDNSERYFLESLKIFEEVNDLLGISGVLNNLGAIYFEEDISKTLSYYKKSLKIIQKLPSELESVGCIHNIGKVYEKLKDYDTAITYFKKALHIVNENENVKYKSLFLHSLGRLYMKRNEFSEAVKCVQQSLKLSQKMKIIEDTKNNFLLFSRIYQKKMDYKLALKYYQKYSEQKDILLNKEMFEKITKIQKKYDENEKKFIELKEINSLITDTLRKTIQMDMIGTSKKIKEVLELAITASIHPYTNVLIMGESGTGKEIIANIIHYASSRKDFPLIAVNCSSIPESLAESEFFGHLKGSFTGAGSDKVGYLELADKGTLFLDEIADTPISLQAKLLRVLENKKIKKLGAKKERQIDFRIISATNKDIEDLIENSRFRLDLLHRINTIEIIIPPLRERRSDIKPLLEHFVFHFSEMLRKPVPKINNAVVEKLEKYRFPGNIRELKNMVEKAMIQLKGNVLESEHFEIKEYKNSEDDQVQTFAFSTIKEMEKQMILKALKQTNYNRTSAAKILGISHSTLRRKLKTL